MQKAEELKEISESLLTFLTKNNLVLKDLSNYEIFNLWCKKEKIKIVHKENVEWALKCIKDKELLTQNINCEQITILFAELKEKKDGTETV